MYWFLVIKSPPKLSQRGLKCSRTHGTPEGTFPFPIFYYNRNWNRNFRTEIETANISMFFQHVLKLLEIAGIVFNLKNVENCKKIPKDKNVIRNLNFNELKM